MKANLRSQSTIRKRGWTQTMINRFLGEPDQLANNPRCRGGAPMKLFDIDRVKAVEQTPEFVAAQKLAEKRRRSLKPSIEARRKKTINTAKTTPISVVRMDTDKLRDAAIKRYNRRQDGHADQSSDPAFLLRITVNFIRHNLTEYDKALEARARQIGAGEALNVIRSRVYKKIALAYPNLADECRRQADRRGVKV